MINNYVKMICGMLELPMPQVFYNDSALEPGQHARAHAGWEAAISEEAENRVAGSAFRGFRRSFGGSGSAAGTLRCITGAIKRGRSFR